MSTTATDPRYQCPSCGGIKKSRRSEVCRPCSNITRSEFARTINLERAAAIKAKASATKKPEYSTECSPGQPHHWIIETPNGNPTCLGTCKLCGEERKFPVFVDRGSWLEATVATQQTVLEIVEGL